jgi:hypothetical protein
MKGKPISPLLSRTVSVLPWLAGAILLAMLLLTITALVQGLPFFYRAPAVSPTAPLAWTQLPTPLVAHPDWTSYSSTAGVRDTAVVGNLRWVATDGGLVVQNVITDEQTVFRAEHGLPVIGSRPWLWGVRGTSGSGRPMGAWGGMRAPCGQALARLMACRVTKS